MLFAAIALYIRLVSRGPILFIQKRVGHKGKVFSCLKFRTMHPEAETQVHSDYMAELMKHGRVMRKLDDAGDKRLIIGGAFLRATGLDELPQLINVWRGEMSLVGPRPCTLYEYANYQPHHKRRFDSMPGLTGLWQISGKNKTTFEEMIALDVRYTQTASLGLDLKIMLLTFPAILQQLTEHCWLCVSSWCGSLSRSQKPTEAA